MDTVAPLETISQDRLFRTQKETTVAGKRLIIRALSSYEIRCRFEEATLASMRARRELRDPEGRRWMLSVGSVLESATDDELRSLIVLGERNQVSLQALADIQPEFTANPDGAKESELMDTQEAREAAIARANELRNKFVAARIAEKQEAVKTWEHDELVKEYTRLAVKTAIDNEYGETYSHTGLLYAVRNPDGSPYFGNLEDVRALDDNVRLLLTAEVRAVNDLNPLRLSGQSSTALPAGPGS